MKYKGSHINLLLPRMYVPPPPHTYTLFFLCYSPFSQIIYLSPFFLPIFSFSFSYFLQLSSYVPEGYFVFLLSTVIKAMQRNTHTYSKYKHIWHGFTYMHSQML